MRCLWFTALIAALCGSVAAAGRTEWSGSVAAEVRWFTDDPRFADQFDGSQSSLVFNPELRYQSDDRRNQFSFIPFWRLDSRDSRRSHFDLREAYWLWVGDELELLVGINKVFWGVTESRHLVDIINQNDFVEDIDNEDKLGQPMINLSVQRDWGWLGLYILPGFREQTFPGKNGRVRTPLPIDGEAQYESGAEQKHVDYALRYSHVLGDWDLGAYYFYGTGREPRLLPNALGTRLVAHYDLIHQTGVDLQYTREAWLWKFEGILRKSQGDTFAATVAGFEYTLYQLFDSAADLGLLFEYLYDGRDKNPQKAPFTAFDDDLFFGARLALNDVQSSELLAGVIIDRDDRSTLLFAEAQRRLGDNWNLEIEGRFFRYVDRDNTLESFGNDSFVNLSLSRYF